MRDLLLAVKAQLQNEATLNFVRDCDIYITEDEYLLPKSANFPAIALKDGHIINLPGTNLNYQQQADLRVTGYVSIKKPEESIVGQKGVLALMELAVACLINNCLSISGVHSVFPHAEEPSELFGDEKNMIQKKTIVMRYSRSKSLPRRS